MPRDRSGHFYYFWYPTIYQQDTQHLSLEEDGAYRRLLDHYMLTRAPLPGDDRSLSRILGISTDEFTKIKTSLVSYFKPTAKCWEHTFCNEALLQDTQRIKKLRDNGRVGGRPKSTK